MVVVIEEHDFGHGCAQLYNTTSLASNYICMWNYSDRLSFVIIKMVQK
jgi:hypothetical protein